MYVFIIVLIGISCGLSALLLLYKKEIRHMLRQLELVEAGSQIELTTAIRSKEFLLLYTKLNHLFITAQKKEQKYMGAQEQLKQTISNIAHDIRTPLTSAAGYLQMLEDSTTSEKQLRYEHIIEGRINELKDMLEELFLYTKLTSDDFSLNCESTAVFPVLSDCLLSLFHLFTEKKVEPNIQFENESICVLATPESLGRIFRNLILNALIHGNGEVCILQRGTAFTFSNLVAEPDSIDTGKMFDRFYKADASRLKGTSGLGLAIVKELVTRTGGNIEAFIVNNRQLNIKITFLPAPGK
jgi:signal transduction histidine kinase